MINKKNILDVIHLWRTKKDIWSDLKKDFPEALADLTSFENNPNCSCGGRLVKFFRGKLDEDATILDKYNKYPEELNKKTKQRESIESSDSLSGKIIEIDKGDESWDAFVNNFLKGKNKKFYGFSVVERPNKIAVYFI